MDILIAEVIGDVALVLLVASVLGAIARRCGQPAVIGQILAGILLGPSALGRLPGHLTARLFPHSALPALTVLSQVAVVIFMFAVGYELDRRALHRRHRAVWLVAVCALIVPMSLGAGSALVFRSQFAALGEPHLSRSMVLFMAVALAITALPVLAAIARERGIAGTVPGVVAASSAGIMDVAAWVALAAALVGTSGRTGRPWPVTLVLALGSAWVTASLGLHPVFGGFLAGLTMPGPDGTPDAEVLRPMEQIGGILLPLFFVVTGLSVNVGALDGDALLLLVILCALASAGKLGPGYLGAKLGGLGRRDAATVAALVNSRGLTELIALNVGLSAGLIDERLFSILVLMAVLTTVATAPLLSLIRAPAAASQGSIAPEAHAGVGYAGVA